MVDFFGAEEVLEAWDTINTECDSDPENISSKDDSIINGNPTQASTCGDEEWSWKPVNEG